MDDGYRDRTAFIRGAKDIAKEVKRQAAKKVGRSVDKVADEYTKRSYSRFEEDDDDDYPQPQDGYYRGDSRHNEDEGANSDSTEGHDEDDEIYEGEYQGIPRADSGKADGLGGPQAEGLAAAGAQFRDFGELAGERRKDREELAQQYETILQECGHGRFQWTLYFVLGLALMADGVEIFVVGFVLPSAEKDMCLSEPNKGMLVCECMYMSGILRFHQNRRGHFAHFAHLVAPSPASGAAVDRIEERTRPNESERSWQTAAKKKYSGKRCLCLCLLFLTVSVQCFDAKPPFLQKGGQRIQIGSPSPLLSVHSPACPEASVLSSYTLPQACRDVNARCATSPTGAASLASQELECQVLNGPAGLIVYLGMMVGAFLWGGLADRIGRRQCLLISLSINSVFAFFSSFVQGYSTFLLCRLLSGVGIGGSIPIVFSYYSEFLAQEKRGEHLSWLCMFWMIGGIYASAMAWAIIPHYGWSFQMGSAYQFHSWRVFVLVCAFPSVFAIAALTTMPESPRFFLENGKHDEAWMVLKQVHDTNMRAKGYPERVFSVTNIKTVKQLDELVEIGADTGAWHRRWRMRLTSLFHQVWGNFLACFSPEYRRTTLMMMAVWFTMSFSYYGLTVWFPDMIKYMQKQDYALRTKFFSREKVEHFTFNFTLENQIHSNGEFFNNNYYGLTVWFPDMIKYMQKQDYALRTKFFSREKVEHFTFNFTLENQIHSNGEFFNNKFINMKMKSMVFEDSLFEECYFEDITSSNTFFRNCTFINTLFYNTDLFKYRFVNSRLLNSTFLHNKEGCMLDFSDDNNAYMIYFVSFLGTLAVLPGNIVSALLMDKIGRLRMLAGSSVMSCISCFFLWFGNNESAMIALLCLFGGISIASWNALDVLTVELYPSDKRTTAFGFLNALCKLAAVLGISIFTSFVGITKAVPIMFASGALAAGSFLALKLPETRGQVLQ
ncbi:SV2A protein, partial [Atractosteus spatula]|nr:SV2A protein [Atractosteus spatula]